MIDDEDDNAILEKSISAKSIIKNIGIIAMILLGAFLIYSGNTPETSTNVFLGFMVICFGATLMQVQKPPVEPFRQTLSILSCTLCGLVKVRNYSDGDFVYKETKDNCTECNKTMEIKQIYSVRLKRPTIETREEPIKKESLVPGRDPLP